MSDIQPEEVWPPMPSPNLTVNYNYHFHAAPGADVVAELQAFRAQLAALTLGTFSLAHSVNVLEDQMAIDFTELTAAVEENTTVDQSALTLIEGLADKIDELAAQVAQEPAVQAALNEAAAALRGSSGTLKDAVIANTPPVVEPPV